jgi:hypothetical protein
MSRTELVHRDTPKLKTDAAKNVVNGPSITFTFCVSLQARRISPILTTARRSSIRLSVLGFSSQAMI